MLKKFRTRQGTKNNNMNETGNILDTLSGEKPLKVQIGISPILAIVLGVFALAIILNTALLVRKKLS